MRNRGFSLLEVIIVVLILGILATLSMPVFQGAKKRAQVAQMLMDFAQIRRTFDYFIIEVASEVDEDGRLFDAASYDLYSLYDIPDDRENFKYVVSATPMWANLELFTMPENNLLMLYSLRYDGTIQFFVVYTDNDWSKYVHLPGATYE